MARPLRLAVAFAVGWVIYLIAAILWTYDGILSLVFQPVVGVVASIVGVGAALVAGLSLRVRPVGRLWRAGRGPAVVLALACVAVMGLGSAIGLTGVYTDPETGREFAAIHPAAALPSYVLLLFALVHWPARRPASDRPR